MRNVLHAVPTGWRRRTYRPPGFPVLASATVMVINLATLALALYLAGCAPTGEPVKLRTVSIVGAAACCIPCVAGVLVPHEDSGTAIRVEAEGGGDFGGCGLRPESGMGRSPEDTHIEPVVWQAGYTGRRVGAVVEVLREGVVVARTGERYVCHQEWATKAYICDTGAE